MVSTTTVTPTASETPQTPPYILIIQETDANIKASSFLVDIEAATTHGEQHGRRLAKDMTCALRIMRRARTSQLYVPPDTEDELTADEAANAAAYSIFHRHCFTWFYHHTVPHDTGSYVRNVEDHNDLLVVPGPCAVVYLNLCSDTSAA